MKKGIIKLMVLMVCVSLCVLFAGAAYAQAEEVLDTEAWVGFVSNLLAALVIVVPAVSVILVKISMIMKKSAEVTKEYQDVQLAIAEAAADGNVDNDELAKIVARGQSAGVQTKELYEMIKDLIAEYRKNK